MVPHPPQILLLHTRPVPEAGRAERLAHCGLAPPPCQPCRGSAEQPAYSMKGLSVWAERPVCLACPPPPASPGEGAVGAGASGLLPSGEKRGPSRNLTQEAPRRGTGLPPLTRGQLHTQEGGEEPGLSANTIQGPSLRGLGTLGARSFPLPLPQPTALERGRGSPVSVLVVDIESLRGAEELCGMGAEGIRTL